jgi:hypothetical protein
VFLLFSQLVVDLPVLVPVERQVALVLVPAAVLQVLVVQVQMMVQKDSFPYQSVEDLAAQLSDAYYKTSVFLFLSLQQIHHLIIPTTMTITFQSKSCCLLSPQWFRIKIGRSSSLLTQFQWLLIFRLQQCN